MHILCSQANRTDYAVKPDCLHWLAFQVCNLTTTRVAEEAGDLHVVRACMLLTASKIADWSSISGNAIWLPAKPAGPAHADMLT